MISNRRADLFTRSKGETLRLTARIVLTILCGWLTAVPAAALDPARSIAQYKHTKWTVDDGAPRGVRAITQARNGYLWLGGAFGLFRFDGISFAEIRYPDGKPVADVSCLMLARNGDIWVGFGSGGVAVFHAGQLRKMPLPEVAFVMDMVQTADSAIWLTLGGPITHQLLRYDRGRWTVVADRFGYPAEQPTKMILARDGTIWTTTLKSLLYLRPGAGRFERVAVPVNKPALPTEDRHGNIWLSDTAGTRLIASHGVLRPGGFPVRYPTPMSKRLGVTLFDRDNNLWGVADGIFRARAPDPVGGASVAAAASAVSRFQVSDGLQTNKPTALFEDREGSIWIGSSLGIERFRSARVVREAALTNNAFWGDTLLSASDGTVYVSEADAVYRIRPGQDPEVLLRATEPQTLCEGLGGAIWVVLHDAAVRFGGTGAARIPMPPGTTGRIVGCAIDRDGKMWLAGAGLGLFGQADGGWRQALSDAQRETLSPVAFYPWPGRGFLVNAVNPGLANLDPPAPVHPLALPPLAFGPVRTVHPLPNGMLIGGQSGLGLIEGGRFRTLPADRYAQFRATAGIVQTKAGQTWLSSAAGIVGVSTEMLMRAFSDPQQTLPMTLLDFRDGLMGVQGRDTFRAAVQGGDGRIWFTTAAGTVWIDPARLPRNRVAPPTAISMLKAGTQTLVDPVATTLSAGTSRVQIDFAALSLSVPQRVQVRYRLEGADRDWIDPGMRRQAFYTNLQPGHYVFRVIAANDDGVWNRAGSKLEFEIPPTFLQSTWFLALCALGVILLLVLAYRLRVRQLQANMRTLLEERLAERERIARDLHDTLLQGFQGLIFRFQSVANGMPKGTDRRSIEQALDSADDVLAEGRESVLHLRATHATELPQALAAVAERLRETYPVEFDLVVEGEAHSLHPVAREELSRIGEEALINAFKHASATKIELAIAYGAQALTLGIRDNGAGIPANVFAGGGRRGHFGLTGMRERATQIDAQFDIASRPGAGTEISVIVPGRVAYAQHGKKRRGWWWRLVGSRQ